jgi:uncharacterized protein (DUF488 family)
MIQPLTAFRISDTDLKKVDKLISVGEFKDRSDFFRRATNKMLDSFQDRLSEKTFFTIGYEGMELNQFIEILRENNIRRLVDVREIPASRKNGFSKNLLSDELEDHGISYLHIPELGSPKDLRDKYRSNRDFDWFEVKYNNYLNKLNGPFTRLKRIVDQEGACLMCFEKDFSVCHRSIIAERLKEEGYTPVHI